MGALGIIADDLTGAMDTGGQFARDGFQTRVYLSSSPTGEAEVAVVDTESREVHPERASQKVSEAAQALRGQPVYKKIDSTLRGNVGQELDALMDALGFRQALITPAFPAAGRTVVQGHLLVHGQPLRETDFAHDPLCPPTGHIPSLLQGQSRRPTAHIPLAVVRQGAGILGQAAASRPEPLLVCDAEEERDLLTIARAAAHLGRGCLTCGSAGLAQALAAGFGLVPRGQPARAPRVSGGPVLVVAGSRREATRRQVQVAHDALGAALVDVHPTRLAQTRTEVLELAGRSLARGQDVILTTAFQPYHPGRNGTVAEGLGALAAALVQGYPLGGLVLTGGAIAFAACQALDIAVLEIEGEVAPGIPAGVAVGGPQDGMRVVTKAGGFGQHDALHKAIEYLHGGRRDD